MDEIPLGKHDKHLITQKRQEMFFCKKQVSKDIEATDNTFF